MIPSDAAAPEPDGMRRVAWSPLDEPARAAVIARPATAQREEIATAVARIVAQVRADGDHTLRALTRRYDDVELATFRVAPEAIAAAVRGIPEDLRSAIAEARARIERFHVATGLSEIALDMGSGIRCERIVRPIERVGLYVPAGSAPLPSTALMLGVPARLARCPRIVLCTPPRRDGSADPAVLAAAHACGIDEVYALGGAQAIAALAYGTDSIPKCDKIFGPGNAYVTEAKRQVAGDPDGAAIDMPAGPSEVLVVADAAANPAWIAADLLAQAEHGPDSQVVLVSDAPALVDAVLVELERQVATLPREAIARRALAGSRAIDVASLADAIDVANRYAPEHLILHVDDPRRWLPGVRNAGSVFLGAHAPEAVGDYCSGTNHVLPTAGAARATSGVSVASFQKSITVQQLTAAGLAAIGPCAMTLARAEGLVAHERAVAIRLQDGGSEGAR